MLRPKLRTHNAPLPLWSHVVFVDWHGVLSRDVFWSSILGNPKHPLHNPLTAATGRLFTVEERMLADWLRGKLTYHDIVTWLIDEMGVEAAPELLVGTLLRDCRKAVVARSLLAELQGYRRDSYLVVATDNMDCFHETIEAIPGLKGMFDATICSSAIGVTKQESIRHFFEPWLHQYGLGFGDAILIDDREDNCRRFIDAGGAAVIYHGPREAADALSSWRRARDGRARGQSGTATG